MRDGCAEGGEGRCPPPELNDHPVRLREGESKASRGSQLRQGECVGARGALPACAGPWLRMEENTVPCSPLMLRWGEILMLCPR